MNNKDFHIIVKDIVSKHGDSIIEKPQFPNLLADLGAYKDLPALKQIVNTLLKSGFGAFLYNLTQNKENNILEKCYEHRMEFISEGKFREDLTEYTYSSLLFALGLIDDIEEPRVKNPFSAEASPNQKKKKRSKAALNLKKMLEDLKKEYLETFNEIIIPKGKIAKASGYFTSETINKQYILEHKISIVSKRLGEDLNWCTTQKEEFLNRHQRSKSAQRSTVGCLALLVIIILSIISTKTYNYISSSEQRTTFETTMLAAKQASENGELLEAINLYKKAEIEYDANWKTDEYKSTARKKAEEVSSVVYQEYKSQIDSTLANNQIIDASYIIKTLPQELVLAGDDWEHYKTTIKNIDASIENEIKLEIDKLISSISRNKKLTDSDKERLEVLTTVAPDNYWLKFISNKEL